MSSYQPDPDRGAQVYAMDRAHVFHSWSAQRALKPLAVAGAEGSYFWDYDGNRYLDFSSQLVNTNIGHQHPKVTAAIAAQAGQAHDHRAAARERGPRRGGRPAGRAGARWHGEGLLHQRRRGRERERHPDGAAAHRPDEGAELLPLLPRQHRRGDQLHRRPAALAERVRRSGTCTSSGPTCTGRRSGRARPSRSASARSRTWSRSSRWRARTRSRPSCWSRSSAPQAC